VVVVPTDPEQRVPGFGGWWDVPVAAASGRAGVVAARAAYDQATTRQREYRAAVAGAAEEESA
jgi:3D-(3,5/4)-trihydroxycyclohexane-1,2-dione acylhydrolase (decyclizing)